MAIPLRHFGDSVEVGDRQQEYLLKVWLEPKGAQCSQAIVGAVPAEPPAIQWVGWGRKKTAVAKAVLRPGSGGITVNGQVMWEYFDGAPPKARDFLRRLFGLVDVDQALAHMEVTATVHGSSPTTMRQVKAAAHAVARALVSYDSGVKELLKQEGFGGVKVAKKFRDRCELTSS